MRNLTLGALIVAVTAFSISLDAQRATRPRPATPPPAPTGPASVQKAAATGIEMTATSANVAESGMVSTCVVMTARTRVVRSGSA